MNTVLNLRYNLLMDKQAQLIVMKHLSVNAPKEFDVVNLLSQNGIRMTQQEFDRFVGHMLLGPGYVGIGKSSFYHFYATEKGVQFGKTVTVDIPEKDEQKKIIFSFKPHNWEESSKVLHEPILDGKSHYADLPIIVYGYDTPKMFLPIKISDSKISIKLAKEESQKNLSKEQTNIEIFEKDGFKMLVCSGSHYTSEKILDIRFMQDLQKQLKTDLLAVSLPTKGRMYVANGSPSSLETIAKFASITQMFYSKSEKDQLSPRLFAVKDGQLLGLIELDSPNQNIEKSEKGGKPGFLKRLFGKN